MSIHAPEIERTQPLRPWGSGCTWVATSPVTSVTDAPAVHRPAVSAARPAVSDTAMDKLFPPEPATSVRISLPVMEEPRGIPDVVDAVTYHSPALDELMVSEDAIEGLTAFAQKRKPQWRNR